MFKNYFSTTFRALKKSPVFTAINVLGLSVGIAAFVLVAVFVRDELGYDKFHKNHDRIYRGMTFYKQGFVTGMPDDLIKLMKESIPEFENVTRIDFGSKTVMEYNGEKVFESEVYKADPEIFEVFDFSLKYGDESEALVTQSSVVLSQYMAMKYFGREDVVGEIFKTANSEEGRTITGVLNEIPNNSRFKFNVLMPFDEKDPDETRPWEPSGLMYVLLNKPVDTQEFSERLEELAVDNGYPSGDNTDFMIENFGELYLNSKWSFTASGVSGNRKFIFIFSVVGVMLLLLACINYINSSTAKSLTRLKEVGVRKVVGASRHNIRLQFYLETGLFVTLAVCVGAGLAEYFLPTLNELADKSLSLNYFSDWFILSFLIALIPFITFLSGFYPALFISRFKMLRVLKGEVSGGKGAFRKVLVVFQLAITLILLFGTQLITKQVGYFLDADIGMNPAGVISAYVPQGTYVSDPSQLGDQRYLRVKSTLEKIPGVEGVTASPFPSVGGSAVTIEWTADNEEKTQRVYPTRVAMNALSLLDIEIIQGRDFIEGSLDDKNNAVIISESLAKAMDLENPIGYPVKSLNDEWKLVPKKIIGVFKDPNFNLKGNPPMRVVSPSDRLYLANIKLDGSNDPETILRISEAWEELDPTSPFQYSFMSDQIASNYDKEKKFGQMIQYFSGMAIFIAALGLFGLSIFTIAQRYKEIGIRKTLGATVAGLTSKLLSSYVMLILIASIIAVPISYYLMDQWLSDFVNHVSIGVLIFISGIGLTILIMGLTVGYQSIKAALMNPVHILRDE